MAELDSITVFNPTKEEFTATFNGEAYTIPAGAERAYPEFLAFHLAKHLSAKMLNDNEVAKEKKTAKKGENPFNPRVGQYLIYDNPERRIYLFDILQSKTLVERALNAMNLKGFIGDIQKYDDYTFAKGKLKGESAKVEEKKVP